MRTVYFRSLFWSIFWLSLILYSEHLLAEGFITGTLVSTPSGFRTIETLRPGDAVIVRTFWGKPTTSHITKVTPIQIKNFVELVVEKQRYFVDNDQKFYLEGKYRSRKAHELCPGDILVGVHGKKAHLEEIYFWHEEIPIEVYALSISRYHNFCVGTDEFITHNMDFFLEVEQTAFLFAAGRGLALSSPVVVVIQGISLLTFGISILVEHMQEKNKQKSSDTKKNSDDKKKNSYQPPQDPKKDNNNHPNGLYKDAAYHHKNSKGGKSKAPKDGQKALDNSVQIDPPAPRRIGVSEDEIVILDKTMEGVFHGHVRAWDELIKTPSMQSACNALIRSRLVDKFGKIL